MIALTEMLNTQPSIRAGEWVVLIGSGLVVILAVMVGIAIYQKPPPVTRTNVETPNGRVGEMIFRQQSCFSCHEVFGNGASYGPSLDGVGSRRTQSWLLEYLRNPRPGVSKKPYRLRMPSYANLGDKKLNAVVSYLQGLRQVEANGRVVGPPEE
jgi:cbb3-type cytochrome oxidase cytochrome c subunit